MLRFDNVVEHDRRLRVVVRAAAAGVDRGADSAGIRTLIQLSICACPAASASRWKRMRVSRNLSRCKCVRLSTTYGSKRRAINATSATRQTTCGCAAHIVDAGDRTTTTIRNIERRRAVTRTESRSDRSEQRRIRRARDRLPVAHQKPVRRCRAAKWEQHTVHAVE